MVEYTISTCVDGNVLKVFWSYCSEVGIWNRERQSVGLRNIMLYSFDLVGFIGNYL